MITVDIPRGSPPSWKDLVQATNKVLRCSARISCVFVPSRAMRTLNNTYRGVDKATNVLSFGWQSNNGVTMGDVILCRPVIRAEVPSQEYRNHIDHLFVHGILHVLGYDHERSKDIRVMERLEMQILGRDPYKS